MEFAELVFGAMKPSNAIYLLLVVGIVLVLARRRRGMSVIVLAALLWGVCAYLPLGDLLARPLEARFEAPRVIEPPAAIILLGGYENSGGGGTPPYDVALNESGDRLTAAAALAVGFPDALVIITDSSGSPGSAAFLAAIGIDPARILVERRARSTYENAIFSRDLVDPASGDTFALVTSAWHMPRAVATFRAAGWSGIVPIPVDRIDGGADSMPVVSLDSAENLVKVDRIVREWLALFAYRLAGRTDSLLPAGTR